VPGGFQSRFYPTPEQKIALAKTSGCARYVYNWALNLRSTAWRERQGRTNYGQTPAALTVLKRQPEVAWLNEVSFLWRPFHNWSTLSIARAVLGAIIASALNA
jgi:putative transposase